MENLSKTVFFIFKLGAVTVSSSLLYPKHFNIHCVCSPRQVSTSTDMQTINSFTVYYECDY